MDHDLRSNWPHYRLPLADKVRKTYYRIRKTCPLCRENLVYSSSYFQPLIVDIDGKIDVSKLRDLTSVVCSCSWSGVVDDLAPPKRKPRRRRPNHVVQSFDLSLHLTKLCLNCKSVKKIDDFHYKSSGIHGRFEICKKCRNSKEGT